MEDFKIMLYLIGGVILLAAVGYFVYKRSSDIATRRVEEEVQDIYDKRAEDYERMAEAVAAEKKAMDFEPAVMEAFRERTKERPQKYKPADSEASGGTVGYVSYAEAAEANELIHREGHWYRQRGYVVYRAWTFAGRAEARDKVVIARAPEDSSAILRWEAAGTEAGRQASDLARSLGTFGIDETFRVAGASAEHFELTFHESPKAALVEFLQKAGKSAVFARLDSSGQLQESDPERATLVLVRFAG